MSWTPWLGVLLLAGLVAVAPADEIAPAPGASNPLTSPFAQRLRELATPVTDQLYAKCLATLAPPMVCECLMRRVPLRFDWLCEVNIIDPLPSPPRLAGRDN